MLVNTSRFGPVDVDETRVIDFPKGLLGFPAYRKYVLLQPAEDSYFYWMQSVEAADLAFVVIERELAAQLVAHLQGDLAIEAQQHAAFADVLGHCAQPLAARFQFDLILDRQRIARLAAALHVEVCHAVELLLSRQDRTRRAHPYLDLAPGDASLPSAPLIGRQVDSMTLFWASTPLGRNEPAEAEWRNRSAEQGAKMNGTPR